MVSWKKRHELQVGDILRSKTPPYQYYQIEKIDLQGFGNNEWQHLTVRDLATNALLEHSCFYDAPYHATYTVVTWYIGLGELCVTDNN